MSDPKSIRVRMAFPRGAILTDFPDWMWAMPSSLHATNSGVYTPDVTFNERFCGVEDAKAYAKDLLARFHSLSLSAEGSNSVGELTKASIHIDRPWRGIPRLSFQLVRHPYEQPTTEMLHQALVAHAAPAVSVSAFPVFEADFPDSASVKAPPTIPYHHDIPTTGFCQIFSPSFIAGCFCNRIYLDNVQCWRRDVIETPEGEALAYWAYDPDELAANDWVETEAQYRARMEMGATIRSGAMRIDPAREYRGPSAARMKLAKPGQLDGNRRYWVPRNILPSDKYQDLAHGECNDYGVILRAGYVPGGEPGGLNPDGSKPIEHVAVLFSRRESAEISVERLSKRGVETWYVDPASEAGRTQLPVPDGIVGW